MKHLFLLVLFIHISISFTSAQTVYPFSYQDRFGLINSKLEIILPPKYAFIDLFPRQWENNCAIFSEIIFENGAGKPLYGLLDKKGEVIIPAKYPQLEYDGNKRFAFCKIGYDSVEVVDIRYSNIIHRQKFTNINSQGGLVALESNQTGSTTILFHNNVAKIWKGGFVRIVYSNETYYYECSDLEKYTYYNSFGEVISAPPDYFDMEEMVSVQSDYNSRNQQKLWDILAEKFGAYNLKPVTIDSGEKVSAIYQNPEDGSFKLLDMDGNTRFEYKGMTALSFIYDQKLPYLQFRVGMYWGLISKGGQLILKPEFQNSFQRLSKDFGYDTFVKHKSGYGGVLNSVEKLYLPKESGYMSE